MYSEEELNLIILSSFEELSYKCKSMMLSGLTKSTPDFDGLKQFLIKSTSDGVYNKIRERFFSPRYREYALKELELRGITCVTYFSEDYPESLRQTPFPPIVLYCKGNVKLLKSRCFAVVGSRRTMPNVLAFTKKLCKDLTTHFTVVTGIADGADSAAIEGAIESGKCISVLAYGFDYIYPAFNEKLIKRVEERGLLISEHTPKTQPKNYLFPIRNRIIAGLAEGTLVVSAGKRSGALITADYAVEYGRELFALPYGIGITSGEGCNSLIKKGAFLTENILDIFSVFSLDFKILEFERLTADEKNLLKLISDAGEAFLPELAEKLNKQPYQLIPVISSLEIKGLVVRLGGNRFAAV